jgi:tetratricopeptide (TPR) repeat protein
MLLSYRLFRRVCFNTLRLGMFVCCSQAVLAAHAQDKSVVAAANAFAQGQQAELSEDYERAAELFELADRIAPTPEALRSATRARNSAGQLTSAAGHAEELLRRYPSDQAARELADKVLATARPTHTRYLLECTEPCTTVVDGLAANVSALRTQSVYVTPGSHQLVIGFEGGRSRGLRLQGVAGEARTIQIAPPAPQVVAKAPPASALGASQSQSARGPATQTNTRDHERAGIAPAYFWTAASLTLATGAVAIWSGVDLLHARDDYQQSRMPTRAQFEAGEKKDTRTSILIGSSAVLAAGTVALALFTDFRGKEQKQTAGLSVDRHGAQWTLLRRF